MPRFPTLDAGNGLDIGQTPQIRANDDVAQAIGRLGLTVRQVADHWIERQHKQAAFDAAAKLDGFDQAEEAGYQAYRQNAPANGAGLHDGWMAQTAARRKSFLASLSPAQRVQVEPGLAAGTEAWGRRAAEDEIVLGKAHENEVLQGNVERWAGIVRADPSRFSEAEDTLAAQIGNAVNNGPEGQQAWRDRAVPALRKALWHGRYGQGQPGGLEALGRGPSAATRGIAPAAGHPSNGQEPSMAQSIRAAAEQLGTSPEDLATVIGYETIGTFSPAQVGGKGDRYLGLIQFGPEERRRYGVSAGQSFDEQMGAVVAYLADRGFRPGMGLLDLYSTVNAGSPGRYDASDGNGTVRSHVERMQHGQGANVARVLADAPAAQPAALDHAPADIPDAHLFADLSEADRNELEEARLRNLNGQRVEAEQARFGARAALASQVERATASLLRTGSYDGPLPSAGDFARTFGAVEGARQFQAFQRTRRIGLEFDAIKTLAPDEQDSALAAARPQGTGPDFSAQNEHYLILREAVAASRRARAEDANAYAVAAFPQLGKAWAQAGASPEGLKAALAATNAAMDRLGIPAEQRRLLPKAMVSQALASFGETAKPMAERLAPLRAALAATGDPRQQQAIFGQLVGAGLPPMLEYAAAAYARGDTPLAERIAEAALGRSGAGGKADGTGVPFASPAAAANAPAGPAPLRSLAGPGIDLGPAATQAFGSSLLGDERASRTEALRACMIGNAERLNGGDRMAAIAQTDRDLAGLRQGGWVPGTYMREPATGAGAQFAFSNTENNPALPGATLQSQEGQALPPGQGSSGGLLDQFVRTPAARQRFLPAGITPGWGTGILGTLNARMSTLLQRVIVRPVATGPSYQGAPVPQYYTLQTDAGTAVILPGATIKQLQTLDSWEQAYKSGSAPFDPALADDHIVDIQNGFNLGAQTALNKLRGIFGFRDPSDTYTEGELDPTKIVSGNGWEFKFRPPTAPGGPIQIVAARFVGTTKDIPRTAGRIWKMRTVPRWPFSPPSNPMKPMRGSTTKRCVEPAISTMPTGSPRSAFMRNREASARARPMDLHRR